MKKNLLMSALIFAVFFTINTFSSVYAVDEPSVISITETSSPAGAGVNGNFYDKGESIIFAVKFDQNVSVIGTPRLKFEAPTSNSNYADFSNQIAPDTLEFTCTVSCKGLSGGDYVSDFNGIKVSDIKQTTTNIIQTITKNSEILDTNFPFNFPSLYLDSDNPIFDKITITSTKSASADGITYINNTHTISANFKLTEKDSFSSQSTISFNSATGGTAIVENFGKSSSGSKDNIDLNGISGLTGNGNLQITNINFLDYADKTLTNALTLPYTPNASIVVDNIVPVIDDVYISTDKQAQNGTDFFAKNGDTIRIQFKVTENYKNDLPVVSIAGRNANVTGSNTNFLATIVVEQSDAEGIFPFTIDVIDYAGNQAIQRTTVDTTSNVTIDRTNPTITSLSIISNNVLDTSLAKTNDTITMDLQVNDNFSTEEIMITDAAFTMLDNGKIFGNKDLVATNGYSNYNLNSIINFTYTTDGSEESEQIVPFQLYISDLAGNVISVNNSNITDGSSVRFDRTNPILRGIKVSAVSSDNSAYLGDAPTYYAKNGDEINFEFKTCDYVDVQIPELDFWGSTNVTISEDTSFNGGDCTGRTGNLGIWRKWIYQIVSASGTEGKIPFEIRVIDKTGNGVVTSQNTNNNSKIIFDNTKPNIPDLNFVKDKKGASTLLQKHRLNAVYTWNKNNDSNPNNANTVSGDWKYIVRLTNISDGLTHNSKLVEFENTYNATSSNYPDIGQTLIPAKLENEPYQFQIITVDKAGNYSQGSEANFDKNDENFGLPWGAENILYTQPYTIGLIGYVRNEDGTKIPDVNVEVSARFGESCNKDKEVCVGSTNNKGFYEILLNPRQDYSGFYTTSSAYRKDIDFYFGEDDYRKDVVIKNVKKDEIESGSKTIIIYTNLKFTNEVGELKQTEIYITSNSAEISRKFINEKEDLLISSLGAIKKIYSNNPDLEIIDNRNNTFLVKGISSIASEKKRADFGVQKTIGGAKTNYRGGVIKNYNFDPKNYNMSGPLTKEESLAEIKILNDGFHAYVKKYINRNGYEISAGFVPGRIPMKRIIEVGHRLKSERESSKEDLSQKILEEFKDHNKSLRLRASDSYRSTISRENFEDYFVYKFAKRPNLKNRPKVAMKKLHNNDNPRFKLKEATVSMSMNVLVKN